MNHATFVRVSQAGTDLLEIEQRALNREGTCSRQRKHVAAGKIFEHDVMKRRTGQVDRGSVSKTVYHVWMANSIECNCFVLKISDEGSFQLRIGLALQIQIERLNDDGAR